MGLSIESKTALSHTLHQAAKLNAEQCQALNNCAGDDTRDRYSAYAAACVLASVAYLEASKNELLEWAEGAAFRRRGLGPYLSNLSADLCQRLGTIAVAARKGRKALDRAIHELGGAAPPELTGSKILRHIEAALFAVRSDPFDESELANARALILLRNALVHYTPEWILRRPPGPLPRSAAELKEHLAGKFELSPFWGELDIPHVYLSGGCCAWALRTVETLVDALRSRVAAASVKNP